MWRCPVEKLAEFLAVDQNTVRRIMKEIGVVQWRRGSGLNQNQVLSVIEYYYLRLGLREIRGGAMSSKKFRRKTMTEKYNERRKAILKAERTKPRCALPE